MVLQARHALKQRQRELEYLYQMGSRSQIDPNAASFDSASISNPITCVTHSSQPHLWFSLRSS
jgi:hypothetical protein